MALLFLVTSISGSDLCIRPDAIIQSGLYYYQEKFTSIVFDHLIYYVSGCTVKPQEEEIEEIKQTMNIALGTVYNLTGIVMNLPLPTLELQCNVTAPVAIVWFTQYNLQFQSSVDWDTGNISLQNFQSNIHDVRS